MIVTNLVLAAMMSCLDIVLRKAQGQCLYIFPEYSDLPMSFMSMISPYRTKSVNSIQGEILIWKTISRQPSCVPKLTPLLNW